MNHAEKLQDFGAPLLLCCTVRDKDGSKGRQRRVEELYVSGAADKLRRERRFAVRKNVRIRNWSNLEVTLWLQKMAETF